MGLSRRLALVLAGWVAVASVYFVTPAAAQAQRGASITAPNPGEQTVSDAYLYLLGRVLVIRQEHADLICQMVQTLGRSALHRRA